MSLNFLLTDLSINLKKSPEDIESGSPFLGTKVDMPEPAKAVPLPETARHSASAAPAAPWNSQRVRTAVIPAPQPLPCSGHQSCSRRVKSKDARKGRFLPGASSKLHRRDGDPSVRTPAQPQHPPAEGSGDRAEIGYGTALPSSLSRTRRAFPSLDSARPMPEASRYL